MVFCHIYMVTFEQVACELLVAGLKRARRD
jgi:hypothetical protein